MSELARAASARSITISLLGSIKIFEKASVRYRGSRVRSIISSLCNLSKDIVLRASVSGNRANIPILFRRL
jgi:hypothetical protein